MTQMIRITPNGSLMFRDPRPFGTGASEARSLGFPWPPTIAGAVRSILVKQQGWLPGNGSELTDQQAATARSWKVWGGLLQFEGETFFPAPADSLPGSGTISALELKTLAAGEGTDLPEGLSLFGPAAAGGKPEHGPAFWSDCHTFDWLAGRQLAGPVDDLGVSPPTERRTHVAMGAATQTAEPGMLFGTERVVFLHRDPGPQFRVREGVIVARLDAPGDPFPCSAVERLGGEGGFATFTRVGDDPFSAIPPAVKDAIATGGGFLKMQLATPAVFGGGWRPGWIHPNTLSGTPPGLEETTLAGTTLKLVAACIPRWTPLSGWDMQKASPKPLWRMATAGSVYCFKSEDDKADMAALLAQSLWLRPVSDNEQQRNDGCGLALWGTWHP